jgi:hypothetical protein
MMFFDKLSFWLIVGVLFFIGFGVIVVTAFLTRPPASRRKKKADRD